jgi:hypothetical protein
LRRIFGRNRDKETGECRKVHNEELNYLYSSPTIVRVMKSKRPRLAGHVAHMREWRGVYSVLVGKPEDDLCVDGKIILGWIFRKWDVGF